MTLKISKNDLADSTEFFCLAISMLENDNKTNLIPELLQILTPNQIIVLSQIFGGKNVRFPTAKELSYALKTALFVYETRFNNKNDSLIASEMEISDSELESIKSKANTWQDMIQKECGVNYFSRVMS